MQSEWQPIETAPKDGTDILLEVIKWDESGRYVATAYWDEHMGWTDNGKGFGIAGYVGDFWMPLPEVPDEK